MWMSGDKSISSIFYSDIRARCCLNQPSLNMVNPWRKKLMLTFSSSLHHRSPFSSPRTRRCVAHLSRLPYPWFKISSGSACCCAHLLLYRPSIIHQQNCESFTSHHACITRSRTSGPCVFIDYHTCTSGEYSCVTLGHSSSLFNSNCSRCNTSDC